MTTKQLIVINGPPGVGKTATCRELYQRLDRCVWLDGDWCWMMNPWRPTEEDKRMVERNIAFLLRGYLTSSSFDYVLFGWVIPSEWILERILGALGDLRFELHRFSLVCSPAALRARMRQDEREESAVEASVRRLPLYQEMNTIKIDTSDLTVSQVADEILRVLQTR